MIRHSTIKLAYIVAICIASAAGVLGQANPAGKAEQTKPPSSPNPVAGTPAYAELALKRTELASELEALMLDYTDDFPKIKELRATIWFIDRDMTRISKVKPAEMLKLSAALGRLMVRRAELETDLWNLLRSYKDEHPDVKRAKRKVEIYDAAINEILS